MFHNTIEDLLSNKKKNTQNTVFVLMYFIESMKNIKWNNYMTENTGKNS